MGLGYAIFLRIALSHFENPCSHDGLIFRDIRTDVPSDIRTFRDLTFISVFSLG